MRYLSITEILEIHDQVISSSGGSRGIRDLKTLESSVNQPRLTFDQKDLYPDIVTKASSLCFALVMNHPFIDGNKRVGHAAMEIFLVLNGYEIDADVNEQEQVMIDLAAGNISRENLSKWLAGKIIHITRRLE
jgi:death-on-curing protein